MTISNNFWIYNHTALTRVKHYNERTKIIEESRGNASVSYMYSAVPRALKKQQRRLLCIDHARVRNISQVVNMTLSTRSSDNQPTTRSIGARPGFARHRWMFATHRKAHNRISKFKRFFFLQSHKGHTTKVLLFGATLLQTGHSDWISEIGVNNQCKAVRSIYTISITTLCTY